MTAGMSAGECALIESNSGDCRRSASSRLLDPDFEAIGMEEESLGFSVGSLVEEGGGGGGGIGGGGGLR